MENILRIVRKLIPKRLFAMAQPVYHYFLAFLGTLLYGFPSKRIKVIAVTGTKGKTSTVEFVNAVLEEAGRKTALAGTLRFKIGKDSRPNMYKMTMPGRFFIHKFLRQAVKAKCQYAVLEISSEASKQFRHKFIDLDTLIFTNLAKEHIESHGSYEKYVDAKLDIARALESSLKLEKRIIVNADDKESEKFLNTKGVEKITYSFREVENVSLNENSVSFKYKGFLFNGNIPGKFSVYNMLSAIKFAESEKISFQNVSEAFRKLSEIKGRAQSIDCGQNFRVIVDYAHTPDSLEAIYGAFLNVKKIGVLGNCGGGRDKWKRKDMALIAEKYCDEIILTDEDPYDDNPKEIVEDMAREMKFKKPEIIMDRREAIASAIKRAKKGDVVIITGKGTDPYIMRAGGKKELWSDAGVVEEELRKYQELKIKMQNDR